MAINSSTSNFVNINNLPQSQEALDTDLLLLQTENGTETITFKNFNVVKSSPNGDVVLNGSLSGSSTTFNSLSSYTLKAAEYKTYNNNSGTSWGPAFANYFTIDNGIVIQAINSLSASPDYLNILNNVLPAMSAYQNTVYKRYAEIIGSFTFGASVEFTSELITNFFATYPISVNNIKPCNFTLMLNKSAARVPYVKNITRPFNTNNLSFEIHLGEFTPSGIVPPDFFPTVEYRLLVTY